MSLQQHFSQREFHNILDEFSKATKRKEYERIEYSLWRKITKYKLAKYSYNIYIGLDFSIGIAVADCEVNYSTIDYIIVPKDCGFTKFIIDKYFVKEVNDATVTANSLYNDCVVKGIDGITCDSDSTAVKSNAISYSNSTVSNCYTDYYYNYDTIDANKINTGYCYNYNTGTISLRDELEKYVKEIVENEKNKNDVIKEEDNKMKGFNFNFGPCTNDNIRMSMYGLAVQNTNGEWVSYNNGDIVNVDIFNFDGRKFMFKMPCTFKDIKVGDILIHNKRPMFVEDIIDTEGGVIVVDTVAGERKEIIPTKNMFGFDIYTKVVSLFDAFSCAPTADQPFGNMLPFLMMEDNKDTDPMMLLMMMNGGKMDMNPMMWYFMFKDNKEIDPAVMWMITSMAAGATPAFMTGNYPKATVPSDK